MEVLDKDQKYKTTAIVLSKNTRMDYAAIFGDFRKFKKLKLRKHMDGIAQNEKGPFKLCGFPHGGKLTCFKYEYKTNYMLMLKGYGFAYGGNSGGPLIDQKTGHAVGIVSAAIDDGIIVSPIVWIYDSLAITNFIKLF